MSRVWRHGPLTTRGYAAASELGLPDQFSEWSYSANRKLGHITTYGPVKSTSRPNARVCAATHGRVDT